jgi:hypothetical protein
MDSLQLALGLAPDVLCCAHAGFVTDAAAALRRKIGYWND